MKDIVFSPSQLKFDAVDFSKVKISETVDCIHQAIDLARKRITDIKEEVNPNFENTIEALEKIQPELEIVQGIFYNLLHAHSNEEMQKIAPEAGKLFASFGSEITLDSDLFRKIETVYKNTDKKDLNQEQVQLLEYTYLEFIRAGAQVSDEKKSRLKEISGELAQLSSQFAENQLKATNAYALHITNETQLAGLPEGSKEAAKETAQSMDKEGWVFTLHAPSMIPFLKYCEDRNLRKDILMAARTLCTTGKWKNSEIAKKTAALRHEKAQILGFENHAEYVLAKKMAQNSKTVRSFLNELYEPSLTAAKKEHQELKDFAKDCGLEDELQQWDIAFYSEKLKEKKYSFNEEELRPYFSLENCIKGVFTHAEKLYNIEFIQSDNFPVYHEDVKVYEVYRKGQDRSDPKNFIGLLYADFFPRASKSSGAWHTNYRDQGYAHKESHGRPHDSIVCNFTKPTKDKPSLLNFQEVRTLFHECGHSLHSLLSQCYYSSLAGPGSVYHDFVELPSQVFENWTLEKEGLALFATHYKTNEVIPDELIEKIKKSNQFRAGSHSLRQLSLGLLDMAWHTTAPSDINEVEEFEIQATKKTQLLPRIPGASISCSFGHIFAGGYSAGYYGYKWSEVLDADAFELFQEKGIFNKEVADSFRENILERGGVEHPMTLYKKFRGREPDPKALLRRSGLN